MSQRSIPSFSASFFYKSLSWKALTKSTLDSAVGTRGRDADGGCFDGHVLALGQHRIGQDAADAIISVSDNPYMLMLLFNVLLLLLGTFLDITPGLLHHEVCFVQAVKAYPNNAD